MKQELVKAVNMESVLPALLFCTIILAINRPNIGLVLHPGGMRFIILLQTEKGELLSTAFINDSIFYLKSPI